MVLVIDNPGVKCIYTSLDLMTCVKSQQHVGYLFTECDQNLPVWNIIVMAISTASFIFGVAVAVTLGILIFLRAKNSDGEVYWHRYAWMFCSV